MRTKVKIEQINRKPKTFNKKGGGTYEGEAVGIRVKDKNGDLVWINGFGSAQNKGWKEGDEVEIIIEKNDKYLNFKEIPPEELFREQVIVELEQIKAALRVIHGIVKEKKV
jgi:hypothetical protein